MEGGVTPLLSSIEDAIEAIFLTAHKEDFSMEAETKQVEVTESIFLTSHKEDLNIKPWHGWHEHATFKIDSCGD